MYPKVIREINQGYHTMTNVTKQLGPVKMSNSWDIADIELMFTVIFMSKPTLGRLFRVEGLTISSTDDSWKVDMFKEIIEILNDELHLENPKWPQGGFKMAHGVRKGVQP